MEKMIFLSSPHLSGDEQKYVKEAFDTNWIAPLGPNVDGFEQDLCRFTGAQHVAALSSGTAALHLALILSGVKQGDEVIASSFTFSASVNPIAYQCATPILIDSEPDTWNMCPQLLEDAIKDRMAKGKKPKAIVLVHLYGMPAKIDEIQAIAEHYDIPLIEDAAEALGSKYKGKRVGTFGDFGVFSFNGNKIITTSGGGALAADSQELIEKARFLSTQARDAAPHYQHSTIGYNYRMSNIAAGIGRGQMEVLENRVKSRREINQWYRENLESIDYIDFLTEPNSDFFSNFWLTTIVFAENNRKNIRPESVRKKLNEYNIQSRPLWKPMHKQPVFEGYPAYVNGTSERFFKNGLCLPSGTNMTTEDKELIIKVLKKIL